MERYEWFGYVSFMDSGDVSFNIHSASDCVIKIGLLTQSSSSVDLPPLNTLTSLNQRHANPL